MNLNPAPELAPQLKQLRLSGIFDSLEARNRQAIEAKMAYTEPHRVSRRPVGLSQTALA